MLKVLCSRLRWIFGLFLFCGIFVTSAQLVCPFPVNDGGPYVISEWDGLQLNAFVEDEIVFARVDNIFGMNWNLLDCFIGEWLNLFVPWEWPGGLQECLINAGGDGDNQPKPNALQYNFTDGFCFLPGQTDFHVVNTAPFGQWTTPCGLPLQWTVDLQYEGFDPALSDFPLTVDIILHEPGGSQTIESTQLDNPGPGTFSFDSTQFPDGTDYQFELQLTDDEETVGGIFLGLCEIANGEEEEEEEEEEENDRVGMLLGEADDVLDELDILGQSVEGFWTKEMLEKLLKMKKELEDAIGTLTDQLNRDQAAKTAIENEIQGLKDMCDDLRKDLKDKKDECDDLQDDIDDLQDEIDDLEGDIDEKTDRVQELQTVLAAGSDSVSVVNTSDGSDPLDGVPSGAAVSFDGGQTHVVAVGEAGVQDLIDAIREFNSIFKEIRGLEKDIRQLKKDKEAKEKEKDKKEKEKERCDKEKQDIEDKIAEKETKITEKEGDKQTAAATVDGLRGDLDALNEKIKKFNELAAECKQAGLDLLKEVKDKYDNAPQDVKDAADETFGGRADQDEQDAWDEPGDDTSGDAGGVAGGAAQKMEDALAAASSCPPPQEKTYGPFIDQVTTYTLRGVEEIKVVDSKGTRWLTAARQKKIFEELSSFIDQTSDADTALSVVDFFTSGNPINLIYGLGFQNQAIDAILEKLKEWSENGKMNGLPEWIKYMYGRLWEIEVTATFKHTDVYECVDGIFQFKESIPTVDITKGECVYSAWDMRTYTPTPTELDLSGCTLGGCPNAWGDAFEKGLAKLKANQLNRRVVAECEG